MFSIWGSVFCGSRLKCDAALKPELQRRNLLGGGSLHRFDLADQLSPLRLFISQNQLDLLDMRATCFLKSRIIHRRLQNQANRRGREAKGSPHRRRFSPGARA